jgi:hypothetical protein
VKEAGKAEGGSEYLSAALTITSIDLYHGL